VVFELGLSCPFVGAFASGNSSGASSASWAAAAALHLETLESERLPVAGAFREGALASGALPERGTLLEAIFFALSICLR
jgi:hypothetical protein